MAVNKIRRGSTAISAIYLGSTKIRRCYLGSTIIWDEPLFVDEPKIDPAHPQANRTTSTMLVDGAIVGTALVSGTTNTVNDAMASGTAGTLAMRSKPLPAANSRTLRISAHIRVDKTSGRYSRVGVCANTATPSTATPDFHVGHVQGQGIVLGGLNGGVSIGHTMIPEAQCVDGAWYRVSATYDNVNDYDTTDTATGRARVMGSAEPIDPVHTPADPWYPPGSSARFDSVGAGAYVPTSLSARTNSALGTIRNVYYIDSALGATSNGTDDVDNAPIHLEFKQTSTTDKTYIYSKGKAAPLRIIVAAGGSGIYGGVSGFGTGLGQNAHPFNAFRKFWRDLAGYGYTIVHAQALHEGWGADDHLTKQIEAINKIKAEWGMDARIYYIAYSMGGASLWRALRGRAGFPAVRAAYNMAGISRIGAYYNNASFPQIKTRWPVEGAIDEPQSYTPAELIARGTRVRMVTSTADTNVSKALEHDPMYAKYAGSGLATERVLGVTHFDPTYWDAADVVAFFEGADA